MSKDRDQSKEVENREWINSLKWVLNNRPGERVKELLAMLQQEAKKYHVEGSQPFTTPYINSILPEDETEYPGDRDLEDKLMALIQTKQSI